MLATSSVGECAPSFHSGVPVELIKMPGDWHSDAVLLYLTIPLAIRLQSVNTIAKSILTTNISTPQPTQFGCYLFRCNIVYILSDYLFYIL